MYPLDTGLFFLVSRYTHFYWLQFKLILENKFILHATYSYSGSIADIAEFLR